MSAHRAAATLAAGVAVSLAGCMPLPLLPHVVPESRGNLGEGRPIWIVDGRTTREDVLLHLGEPDRRGVGDRWFSYEAARSLGGVQIVVGGYGRAVVAATRDTLRHRVLAVRFDATGVVTSATYAEVVCGSWAPGSDSPLPCANLAALADPRAAGDRAEAQAIVPVEPGERVFESFIAASRRVGDRWIDGAVFVSDRALYFLVRSGQDEPIAEVQFQLSGRQIERANWVDDAPDGGTDYRVRVKSIEGAEEVVAFRELRADVPPGSRSFDRARAQRFMEAVALLKRRTAQ